MGGRTRGTVIAVAAGLAVAATNLGGPATSRADPECLSVPTPALTAPAAPLRFGITPLAAGSAGASQGQVVPEDPAKAAAALHALQPPHRRLVIRINRVFESDGTAGLARAAKLAGAYSRMGFDVEAQVRYHPTTAENGDMAAWERYVRQAVELLSANRSLVALTITNEVNLPLSSNTSDGAYENPIAAIVDGIVAARAELVARHRPGVQLGFTYAYRYAPNADLSFWKSIGAAATPAFRAALGYVGVQLYPDLFYPPALTPGQTAGDATIQALALVRDCYMPLAGLGASTHLWITENGYATNLGHTESGQLTDLQTTVTDVHRYSGTLGVTDYRYFNLRDNRPGGTDLFDDVGLLRSDYSAKPSFAALRALIAGDGVTARATARRRGRRAGNRRSRKPAPRASARTPGP